MRNQRYKLKVCYLYVLKSDAIIIAIHSIDYIVLCIDDWWCDQFRWSNQGVQKLPTKDPTIKKSYFFYF